MTAASPVPPVQEFPVGDPDAMLPVVYQAPNMEWRWSLRNVNGKIVGASTESYHNRDDAIHNALTVTQRSAYVLRTGEGVGDADALRFAAVSDVLAGAEFIARPVR